MSTAATSAENQCTRCGAALPAGAKNCWLCYSPVDPSAKAAALSGQPTPIVSHASFDSSSGFSLASLMMFVTLVCVVLGVSTIAPGVGIPLAVLFFAAWFRTAAVARQRAARGLELNQVQRIQLFFASFGVTLTLISLVALAGFCTFWAACFACMGTYFGLEGLGNDFAMLAAWGVCAGVVLLALFVAFRYVIPFANRIVRRRWRRDIGETDESA